MTCMGFLAGALAEEDFLAGAMVAKACGGRWGLFCSGERRGFPPWL